MPTRLLFIISVLVVSLYFQVAEAGNPVAIINPKADLVTPEIATGFFRTNKIAYESTNYSMLICPEDAVFVEKDKSCFKGNRVIAWVPIAESVPKGRTFVGFKSLSVTTGNPVIEVYWK